MRNIGLTIVKKENDDAGLHQMLTDARMQERKGRAEVMAARLERLAGYITSKQLTLIEAVEVLREEAVLIRNEAQEIH